MSFNTKLCLDCIELNVQIRAGLGSDPNDPSQKSKSFSCSFSLGPISCLFSLFFGMNINLKNFSLLYNNGTFILVLY